MFDASKFFGGMKGRFAGNWYPMITCDFEDRTITIDVFGPRVIQCHQIEALEKPGPVSNGKSIDRQVETERLDPCGICGISCCTETLHTDEDIDLWVARFIRKNTSPI